MSPEWEPLSDEHLAQILAPDGTQYITGEEYCDHDVYCLAQEVHECRDVLRQLVAMRQPLPGGWTAKIKALLERITGDPTCTTNP